MTEPQVTTAEERNGHVDQVDREQPVRRRDDREVNGLGGDEDSPVRLQRREQVLQTRRSKTIRQLRRAIESGVQGVHGAASA